MDFFPIHLLKGKIGRRFYQEKGIVAYPYHPCMVYLIYLHFVDLKIEDCFPFFPILILMKVLYTYTYNIYIYININIHMYIYKYISTHMYIHTPIPCTSGPPKKNKLV